MTGHKLASRSPDGGLRGVGACPRPIKRHRHLLLPHALARTSMRSLARPPLAVVSETEPLPPAGQLGPQPDVSILRIVNWIVS